MSVTLGRKFWREIAGIETDVLSRETAKALSKKLSGGVKRSGLASRPPEIVSQIALQNYSQGDLSGSYAAYQVETWAASKLAKLDETARQNVLDTVVRASNGEVDDIVRKLVVHFANNE